MAETSQGNGPPLDQRAFFDRLIVEQWHTYINPAWDAARRLEVRRIMAVARPRRILDVGCGCGFHDLEMANYPGVEQVLGIDNSARSAEVAEKVYPHPSVRRQEADVHSLAAEPFDLVTSFQVIEHSPHGDAFLARCAELTAPGGWTAVVTPNGRHLENRLRRLLGRKTVMRDPNHFIEYSIDEVVAMGQRVGLRPVATFGHGVTLPVPVLGRAFPGATIGRRLGSLFPAIADVIGVVFRKPSATDATDAADV